MGFVLYAILFTILGLLIYQFLWKDKHEQENKQEEMLDNESNTNIKDKLIKTKELIMDWEVAKELSVNLREEKVSSIEVIKPTIEFFEVAEYPELADYELETKFYQNRITALVRDPYWAYLYWEVETTFGVSGSAILKVLDITDRNYPVESAHSHFTVDIELSADNWYIQLPAANRTYTVELGIVDNEGFTLLARSNYFTTPRDKPSDKIDPEWMTLDEVFKRGYKYRQEDQEGASPVGKEEEFAQHISSPELIRDE
ncbi:DUF4912 domain-containing protein [Fuchsiella alkaliacetigena]|uniref:DUF4912 domain-containing protein n=1 Tax=Fuchsiella alkaliacetigena TaxID=957042 RepID=UPI002009E8AC|nr:DUF4912 domain-containing protein [Fuchsiella alkaliacetigena]MCK8824857.1 DUF4912 domain-containing protein [Fuchsiella alkaliacetigena]